MTKQELLKTAKPILFNTEMVRAILDNRKTVTRRIINPKLRDDEYGFCVWYNKEMQTYVVEKYDEDEGDFYPTRYVEPKYQIGDILYVRETWCYGSDTTKILFDPEPRAYDVLYRADNPISDTDIVRWHPSIHMPKEAARIFLKVTDVKVQRLKDITDKQAKREGVIVVTNMSGLMHKVEFASLWDSTIKKQDIEQYGWKANPWVWVISFERVNVDG